MLPIEVLVEAVVIARSIAEQQRRGTGLAGGATTIEKRVMIGWEPYVRSHAFLPAVRDGHKLRIERRSQRRDEAR